MLSAQRSRGEKKLDANLPSMEGVPFDEKRGFWTPSSWELKEAKQQPFYEDKQILKQVLSKIHESTPIVTEKDILTLKKEISQASLGHNFLLQCGDCAELFEECREEIIQNKIKHTLKLKDILEFGLGKSVTPIGRIAGQYAKPRSYETEWSAGFSYPTYKGDIVHSREFHPTARKIDPLRILTAYEKSQESYHYIKKYLQEKSFYISHESLFLHYESAMTRKSMSSQSYYNYSAHMVWLGERTRELNGAHVEYLRGINNPIGIKLSEKISNEELKRIILTLNPFGEEGKIILIPRLGARAVEEHLPRFLKTVQQASLLVTWMCDPMHGNGEHLTNGLKTRRLDKITLELLKSAEIHKNFGTILGGLHLETSAEDVTECLDEYELNSPSKLEQNYRSACDPRLNPRQTEKLLKDFIKL